MKNAELNKLVSNGVVVVECDLVLEENIDIDADLMIVKGNIFGKKGARFNIKAGNIDAFDIIARNITAGDIIARNINALDINARNINARNITALDINALDINAGNITAGNIESGNIDAGNIKAQDINALDINARNILYYAVCFAYKNIKCTSIKGKREHSRHFAIDGKVEVKSGGRK